MPPVLYMGQAQGGIIAPRCAAGSRGMLGTSEVHNITQKRSIFDLWLLLKNRCFGGQRAEVPR